MSEIPRDVALAIKLVIFDVDGVLTDNGVYIGDGVEFKRFDIQDGLGLRLIRNAGLKIAFVSGRFSPATASRAAELDIECYQGDAGHKMKGVRALMEKHGVAWSEVAWLGDDLPDLPALRQCALPCAVANAVDEVLECAVYVTKRNGGQGAVREFVHAFLEARGQLKQIVDDYIAARQ